MSATSKVWSNGELISFEDAKIHMLSHGFSRGSAVFEVFGIHSTPEGVVAFRMDEHLKRLERTCRLLGMELSYNSAELAAAVKTIVKENDMRIGHVKIMAYYSEISLGNMVPEDKLELAVFTLPAAADPVFSNNRTVTACISKWCKMHPRTAPPMAKACAYYLNGFLARQDAKQQGYDIGILLDTHGFVAEGSLESLFMAKEGVLMTPPLGRVLASISRMSILEMAPVFGIKILETSILPEDLAIADEIFFSGTPAKVLPVKTLGPLSHFGKRHLDSPGPIAQKLADGLMEIVNLKHDRFRPWLQPLTG